MIVTRHRPLRHRNSQVIHPVRNDARFWSASGTPVSLRFQPVFTAQGQVHEYAVLGHCRASPWSSLAPAGMNAGLLEGAAFFQRFNAPIELSCEHPLDVTAPTDLAERLCVDLGIGLEGDRLWINKRMRYDDITPLMVEAERVTFTVPLTDRLSERADILARYPEFQARLRARLSPGAKNGRALRHGLLHAVGLHVHIPLGLAENRSLQGRFFTLMERAWHASLQVVASGVDDICDFAWMRLHSDLLFRGRALSAPLSADCLDTWLQADSGAWRTFNACTTRFFSGEGA